jgi:hypothetical protein
MGIKKSRGSAGYWATPRDIFIRLDQVDSQAVQLKLKAKAGAQDTAL